MRIDFVISALRGGGAERVMSAVGNKFSQEGHEIRIITLSKTDDSYELDPRIERIHLVDLSGSISRVTFFFELFRLYKSKSNRPHTIVSFLTLTNLIAILVGKLRSIPVVVSEHNNHTFQEKPKWLTKVTWNVFYRLAHSVTVLTSFDIPYFRRKGCNVVVMPNPVTFKAAEEWNPIRTKTIIAIGKLNRYHHKGFDNLIEIAAPVLRKYPDWKLKILGDGKMGMALLKGLILQERMEDQIELKGFVRNVKDALNSCSVFILPSRYEGLPMVLLEAMSQGTACLAYDCVTGPSDIINHEVNGLLVPNQDSIQMRSELTRLINDPDERQFLGKNAMDSLQRFSIEEIYQKWITLVEETKCDEA